MTSVGSDSHASAGPGAHIVRMANQIAVAFLSAADPETATFEHIRSFWDPRMRAAILAHLAAGGAGLDPLARAAVERLSEGSTA